jgi:starch-binding outer membrane protein, SusD/RagB family
MKTKNISIAIILLLVLMVMGCSEDWLDEKPPHLITTESLYTSLDGFETGLNGLYSLVREEREGRSGSNYLRADMFMNGTDNMVTNHRDGFARVAEDWVSQNSPVNADIRSNFIWLYQIINSANTIINQAERREDVNWGSPATAQTNKNRVLAEAKAIRAWAYRHLTFSWGDVPLSLEESLGSTIKTDWERTPVEQVRQQMKADWLFAEQHLNVEPPVRGKITKGTVQHYLSELYLVLGKADSALIWANNVINTPNYQLITQRYGVRSNQPGVPFMDMFYDGNSNREEGNKEALWVWQWEFETIGGGQNIMRRWHSSRYESISIGGVRPLQFTMERGGRGLSRMSLTKWAIDNYEPQDHRASNFAIRKYFILSDAIQNAPADADRLPAGYNFGDTIKLAWTNDITAASRNRTNWPFSRKWESTPITNLQEAGQYNDQVYLRLAETYLLKAEAQLLLGFPGDAAETLNIIRARSNASPVTANDVTIDFILDERSRELLVEEHRRYTLLRTGKWLERVNLYNKNGGQIATDRDQLFPIPQTVLDANLTRPMPQNPGFN